MARYVLVAFLLLVHSGARAQDVAPDAPPPAEAAPVAPAEAAAAIPQPAQSPRVVVVVRGGDPSADLVRAATELETQLAAAGLTLPADEGMRVVLRGGVPAAPEGYEPARAARLRLGWSAEGDREALAGIGRFVEADAVVVVTSSVSGITVEVFDPGASDFYEGSAPIVADDPSPAVSFVRTRARAALRRRIEPAAVARAEQSTARTTSANVTGRDTAPAEPEQEERWIKRNWPIILAGALLGGTISYFVVSRRRDDTSDPPVIHIHPGRN